MSVRRAAVLDVYKRQMQDDSSIIKAEIRTKEEYKELVRKGAVGEIVGRIYDKNGQTVDELSLIHISYLSWKAIWK